jgi:hypothetical protein
MDLCYIKQLIYCYYIELFFWVLDVHAIIFTFILLASPTYLQEDISHPLLEHLDSRSNQHIL